jgi:hypothetical protein
MWCIKLVLFSFAGLPMMRPLITTLGQMKCLNLYLERYFLVMDLSWQNHELICPLCGDLWLAVIAEENPDVCVCMHKFVLAAALIIFGLVESFHCLHGRLLWAHLNLFFHWTSLHFQLNFGSAKLTSMMIFQYRSAASLVVFLAIMFSLLEAPFYVESRWYILANQCWKLETLFMLQFFLDEYVLNALALFGIEIFLDDVNVDTIIDDFERCSKSFLMITSH